MKIGLDLDNTIANCDSVFRIVASNLIGNVHVDLLSNRVLLRQYIRNTFGDNKWTEIQSLVYGPYYSKSIPNEGVIDFINQLIKLDHQVYIVSHKTTFDSFCGLYNLQNYATKWLNKNIFNHLIKKLDGLYFEETIENKIKRIQILNCSIFIDDLLDIVNKLNKVNIKAIHFSKIENDVENKKIWKKILQEIKKYD